MEDHAPPTNLIGFSTLGCPAWSFAEAVEKADAWGADVIEIRFFNGRTIAPDVSGDELRDAVSVLRSTRVKPCTLATGVKLSEGTTAADDLNRMIDIADELGCRQLRVFAGAVEGEPDIAAMAKVALAAVDHAAACDVRIGIETHDSVKSGRSVASLASAVGHPAFGIVWDLVHTTVAGETPAASWEVMAPHVIEVQVKDARIGPPVKPVLLGDGDVDWRGGLAVVHRAGFSGPLILEWEKAWHPDLAEPEIAIPYELDQLRAALRGID